MRSYRKLRMRLFNLYYSLRKKKFAKDKNSEKAIIEVKSTHKPAFYDFVKKVYLDHGIEWDSINIFGLRDTQNIEKDVFNDLIGVAINKKVHLFKATCDPSIYWTNQKGGSHRKGVAHLCLGYYKNVYMLGKHRGYEALVQYGNAVKVWRDGNNNFRKDNLDMLEKGYFGINIHRASANKVVDKIGRYSAGCQVIQSVDDFMKFLEIVKSSDKFKQKGKKSKFSYFLLNKSVIPKEYLK